MYVVVGVVIVVVRGGGGCADAFMAVSDHYA